MKTPDHNYKRQMIRSYIAAAIWAGHDWDNMDESDNPSDLDDYSEDDVTVSGYMRAARDCLDFYASCQDIAHDWDADQFGIDFYLTRCGHGAGFWDRGKGPIGDALTDRAKVYGSADLFVTDTNQLDWM